MSTVVKLPDQITDQVNVECFASLWELYSRHKNNFKKIYPAHSVITKRDFILRDSSFWEKYTKLIGSCGSSVWQ